MSLFGVVLQKGKTSLFSLFWVKLTVFSFWVCRWASSPEPYTSNCSPPEAPAETRRGRSSQIMLEHSMKDLLQEPALLDKQGQTERNGGGKQQKLGGSWAMRAPKIATANRCDFLSRTSPSSAKPQRGRSLPRKIAKKNRNRYRFSVVRKNRKAVWTLGKKGPFWNPKIAAIFSPASGNRNRNHNRRPKPPKYIHFGPDYVVTWRFATWVISEVT